ncbi:MAG: Inorganic pyrophosphatase [Chloroflexi bacterium]|nr:Inorganic pyrophosphatase [Chloroflexota bacterium]
MKSDSSFYKWRPHPWHGLEVGPNPPHVVHAYIEICPFDLVKYEIDKETGYLRAARPQRTSSQPPTLYGFIPRTYAGERVGKLMSGSKRGDKDPLDICVVSERLISRGEVILNARVVGGIPTHTEDVSIRETYGKEHAEKVILAAMKDYGETCCD